MENKARTKKYLSVVLALGLITGSLPTAGFAETFTTTVNKGTANEKTVVHTTDWQLKEENLRGKNFWPLAQKQYLREVSSLAEPMKNPMIGYGGYFVRPDGRTVIRLTLRKFDKVGTAVWHIMQMKLDDSFNDMVDWNDTQTGIYQGVSAKSSAGWYNDDLAYDTITPFGTTSLTDTGANNVKEVDIADNGNTGPTAALNEVPINLVLKEGQSIASFQNEPLVQMRMLARDKQQVACYTDAGIDKGNYSTYTFSSIVPLKHNYEQNLLREIRQSVTTDRAFRAAGSSVRYNKGKGYIEVRHRYNKVAMTINQLYGRQLGYRQTVNKKFFDVLKPKDASGTIAHVFSTSNNGLPTFGRLNGNGDPTTTGSVPVLKENINFLPGSDLGFIQVAANDFYRGSEVQEGIKTNFTSNQPLDSWLDGIESLLNNGQGTTVRYYVDTTKVDKLLGGDDGLQYFPFYSAIIMDNKDGQYKYTFTLNNEVKLKAGDKIKIDFTKAYGGGSLSNSARARNRELRLGIRGEGTEMFLGSNFRNAGRGFTYEYTIQKGMAMTLKKGTKITLFANYPDGELAKLHFNNDVGNLYQANYVQDQNPIVLDWQATYSAGTVATTFHKPDIDEIFLGDTNISGRTAYNNAEVTIKKSETDQDPQTIIAKDGNSSNQGDSRIDVVVNNIKTKGYKFDTKSPGKKEDGKTLRTFTMPELKRDMPLLFTNTNAEILAEESRPAVVEQVQAKVDFDLNGAKSKDNKAVIKKIAPLSKEYRFKLEDGTENTAYKPSGFADENVKIDTKKPTVKVKEKIDGKEVERTFQNVLSHDGKAYDIDNADSKIAKAEKEALKLRQMPDKNDINVPQGKRLLGWTTMKLEEKVENGNKISVAEQFNDLKDKDQRIKDVKDWEKVDARGNSEAFIFDANSPIDKNRTVYAAYGEGINLILHANNTTDPKDETTITIPLTISDIDKTNTILDAVSSATFSRQRDNLIIKELPKVPVTGEQTDLDRIDDAKAKLFNKEKHSFIGWTTKKYPEANDQELAAGNNNERIGELTQGLVAHGTKRIPQKTEWLKDLNTVQNKFYIPNGYNVAIRPQDVDKTYTDIKKAIEAGKDIHLYANYRPFFKVTVHASYKKIDSAQGQYGKYVDTVEATKKKTANIALLRRTAVTNYGTPTVHQDATYYPFTDGIKKWNGTEQDLTWEVPGFDELGQRLSYVSLVVPEDKKDAYTNFRVPHWGALGMKTYLRVNHSDGTTTIEPTAPRNLHEGAGNPYGDPLAKNQAYSLGVDAYTSATSRKATTVDRQGTEEVTGYTIWNTSTPIDIPQPVFDNVFDTDSVVKLSWGEAEKQADIKKIKLKVADSPEVMLEKQANGTYTGGRLTAKINGDRLEIRELNLKGKAGQNIIANYIVKKAGQEQMGPQGDIQINKKGNSAPVERMKQIPNDGDNKPVIEFDIPNPKLNKPTKDTVYQVQKWDKTTNKWVDVPAKYDMTSNDQPGETKKISIPDGVVHDDIIRIVSKQPDLPPTASTQTMDDLGKVSGEFDGSVTDTLTKDKNYVQLDMAPPAIDDEKAEDELFRRFIDIRSAIHEIPAGRQVTVKVHYNNGRSDDFEETFEISVDHPNPDRKYVIERLNTILRQDDQGATITLIAADEYGNKTERELKYTPTYVLLVQIKGERAGKKFVKVTADKAGAKVTIKVMRGGSIIEDKYVMIDTANEFKKFEFTDVLKSGDELIISGTATEGNNKTYTTNPYKITIK